MYASACREITRLLSLTLFFANIHKSNESGALSIKEYFNMIEESLQMKRFEAKIAYFDSLFSVFH